MAVYKTKKLLLTITSTKLGTFLNQLVKDSLSIEFLNPIDLGEEWVNLKYIKPNTENETSDLYQLSELFKFYPVGGFWSLFEDSRIESTVNELKHGINNRKDLMYMASKLPHLKECQKKLGEIAKYESKEGGFEVKIILFLKKKSIVFMRN